MDFRRPPATVDPVDNCRRQLVVGQADRQIRRAEREREGDRRSRPSGPAGDTGCGGAVAGAWRKRRKGLMVFACGASNMHQLY